MALIDEDADDGNPCDVLSRDALSLFAACFSINDVLFVSCLLVSALLAAEDAPCPSDGVPIFVLDAVWPISLVDVLSVLSDNVRSLILVELRSLAPDNVRSLSLVDVLSVLIDAVRAVSLVEVRRDDKGISLAPSVPLFDKVRSISLDPLLAAIPAPL